jgi:hypothetical protein
VLVADTVANRIRKIIIASGAVTTYTGSGDATSGMVCYVDGAATEQDGSAMALFNAPYDVTIAGGSTFVPERENHTVRVVTSITLLDVCALCANDPCGLGVGADACTDAGAATTFDLPCDATISHDGIFARIADKNNNKLGKLMLATGLVIVTSLAGRAGAPPVR